MSASKTPIKKKPNTTPFIVRSLTALVAVAGVGMVCSAGMFTLEGHMATVWPAFVLVMAGPLLFPFILFPAGVMAGLWNALHTKHKAVVQSFAVASVAYIAAIMAATLGLMAALATGLPSYSPPFFVQMFVVTGAVTPWAVFALRDRNNQLFIVLCWAMLIAGMLVLPARGMGALAYGALAWVVMLVLLLIEHLRQTQVLAAKQRADRKSVV